MAHPNDNTQVANFIFKYPRRSLNTLQEVARAGPPFRTRGAWAITSTLCADRSRPAEKPQTGGGRRSRDDHNEEWCPQPEGDRGSHQRAEPRVE